MTTDHTQRPTLHVNGGVVRIVTLALAVLLVSNVAAQGPPLPAFEVASVKVNRTGAPLQHYPTL